MTDSAKTTVSRRTLMRGIGWSVPAAAVALAAPRAPAAPSESAPCDDQWAVIDNCAVQLPEEFSFTSFSTTTAVGGGTHYRVLFTTRIQPGPPVPAAATGYRIDSLNISGTKRDGAAFSVTPSISERGSRAIWIRADSSLGFDLDVPWGAASLVRSFAYIYNVVYLNALTEIQTCTYVTTMTLANNGAVDGAVGSVSFSPPRLTACAG